ncbi:MAG: TerB family tellurite resistance protein [Gammaproteobacteria bacterium]|nr:TerB family tellurite resistance protein [Gammaproteobacteria bacterium]
MLGAIKKLFEQQMLGEAQNDVEHQLKLATAALLIEMMRQDDHLHEDEERALKASLKEKFGLNDAETDELIQLAHQEAKDATDYYQFTRLINDNYTPEQKIKVVEYLWVIAYADGELDRYEEHMVRRISELIYVSHKDFMQAKHRVVDSL